MILSDKPIVEKAPLQSGNDGLLMTQYSKYYVEDVGLLKIDFLGLRNLSIMANILQTIKKQGKLDFSISEINLNDPKTLKLFQDGKTDGVFQFESSGIKSVLKRMHPDNFNLIAAVNALYRPGPMENIDTFIARKNGKEKVDYQNDAIKKILGSTYGIIVYQEQVMQLAATMGGFSLGQADVLRRAMSKKHRNEMDSMRERFINGSITNGYSKETAETTFEYIERFASYGFNKSHAIAYSKMAFELAYLKAHFPGPFFAALLNSVLGNKNKIKNYVQEAKDNQIKVLTPDINYSNPEFVYQNESIKFGFNAVKGLRSDFIKELIRIRKSSGLFTSLSDFINRMEKKFRKEDQIKALIYAGAFDNFGYNRRELIEALPGLINSAELSGSLLESIPGLEVNIKRKADFLDWEKINFENEYLGTFLSGHPVERYNDLKEQKHTYRINELHDGQKHVSAILLISHIKVIRTKKGQLMAFIDGSDQFGTVDITIFPQLYAQIGQSLKQNMVVLVQGNVEKRRELQIIADSIQPAANVVHQIENNRSVKNKKLFLQISEELDNKTVYEKMKNIFVENHGKTPIILYRKKSRKKQILDHKFNIALNPKLIKELSDLLGKDNVVTR